MIKNTHFSSLKNYFPWHAQYFSHKRISPPPSRYPAPRFLTHFIVRHMVGKAVIRFRYVPERSYEPDQRTASHPALAC